MHDDKLKELIKGAEMDVPKSLSDRIDDILKELPESRRTVSFIKYIAGAAAACIILLAITAAATPWGRARAAEFIRWLKNAVFVQGDAAKDDADISGMDGIAKRYSNADELTDSMHIEVLTADGTGAIDFSVEKGFMRIVSFCGDIRIYQHTLYDGKAYEHGVLTDGMDNDEPYSIIVDGVELAGYISDKGCCIVGSKNGMWFEVSSGTASKDEFTEFTRKLVMKGGSK